MAINNYAEIQQSLDALNGAAGFQSHAHLLHGFLMLRAKHYNEATEDFSYCFDHPDTRVKARVLAGECYYRQGKFGEAERVLRDALVIDRNNVAAYHWLASVLYDSGAYGHARSCLLKVVELTPQEGKPHWVLAKLSLLHGEYSETIKELQKALKGRLNEKQRKTIYLDLATVQVETRQYTDALESLSKCPVSAPALTLKAECRYSEGDKVQAQKLLEQALKMEPDNVAALNLRGKMLLESGDAAGAVPVLLKAEALRYSDTLTHYKLAAAYRQLGNLAAADLETKCSLEIQKISLKADALEKQAAQEPKNARLRYELGTLSLKCREPDQAERWFKAALGLDPSFKQAQVALNKISSAKKPASSKGRRLKRE